MTMYSVEAVPNVPNAQEWMGKFSCDETMVRQRRARFSTNCRTKLVLRSLFTTSVIFRR